MSNEELSQLFYLRREIKHIQAEIARFENMRLSQPWREPVRELLDVLLDSLNKRQTERAQAIAFIEAISDPWIKKAFVLRYEKGYTWLQISFVLNISEDCCKKMVLRYIRKNG